MDRIVRGLYSFRVLHAAPSVMLCIAIQQLLPDSSRGNSQTIAKPWYRREIADHDNLILWRFFFAQKGNCALLGVVAVNPFKTSWIRIQFVERRMLLINEVQLLDPSL